MNTLDGSAARMRATSIVTIAASSTAPARYLPSRTVLALTAVSLVVCRWEEQSRRAFAWQRRPGARFFQGGSTAGSQRCEQGVNSLEKELTCQIVLMN